MPFPYEEFDLSGVRTYPLASRVSKIGAADLAKPYHPGAGIRAFLASLPNILAAADFTAVVAAIRSARDGQRGIIWGLGAHVIKTGLSPVVIDLMERGFVSALATNGAGVIHDFELALSGATSEEVDEALGPGRFGMAEETGTLLNAAITGGVERGMGIGQAVGRRLREMQPAHEPLSIMAAAARLQIPVTVHVGIGTDIIHMHKDASGAALGEGSLRDFRYFVSNVARLGGGVYLNCGSAVVLPEVFLKAVALARNQGVSLDGLTTV
nr:deoxyhypusine synthase family protein [Acidobacteriota bacterium]